MNDFEYEVDKNQVTITRYRGTDEDVMVHDTINRMPVTSIGAYAFRECTGLTSIHLPNSIKTIGDWAFSRCHSLTSVTMPDGCSIGEDAFEDCPAVITIRKQEDE